MHPGFRFLLGVVATFAAIYGGAYAVIPFHPTTEHTFEALYRPAMLGILLASFYLLGRIADQDDHPFASMGLGLDRPFVKEMFLGTAFGAGMICLAVVAIKIGGDYFWTVLDPGTLWLRLLNRGWILLAGALAEEVAFRGYPFQRLVEAVRSRLIAVVLVSGLFGVIHLWNPNVNVWGFLNTVLIGALLAMAYLRTGSLWLAWGVHFGWNFAMGAVFGLPVSGLDLFQTITAGYAVGPDWLTGGSYGIEASATGTVVILIGMGLLLAVVPQQAQMPAGSSPAGCNSGQSGES